ncbi:MAG TPA: SPFH domain-containing protein [Candidatus Paceibacterota bacterium]|nr:SPFH domain-containing protein [Candidatus Paceibacterota bacterium]
MLSFMKAPPTTYVLHYKDGKMKRQGAGLSFIYYLPTSTIVAIPMASADVPFVFQEITADFQSVTIQGQLTYRVADPKRLASLLDFSIDSRHAYYSDDPRKLPERLIHTLQTLTRAITQRLTLREALVSSDAIVVEALAALRKSEAVSALGVDLLGLSILGVKPTPETGRALEAEAREALHRRADEAIYARRNAAVEQERLIKESELNTEIAVEEKRRRIRETQMAAEIAVEEQRAQLIDRRVANERKDADSRAYTLTQTLQPLRELPWKTLMMLGGKNADPKTLVALAFQEMAENAQKIGELNVSPDLLESLVGRAEN